LRPIVTNPKVPTAGRRSTIGRVATDLAIILIAVPSAVDFLAPMPRGYCAMTEEFYAFSLGLTILGVQAFLLALRAMSGAEAWLAHQTESRSQPKPQPLDDF
jgi:hypothetical protein